jgi:hypothetical protein
MELFWLLYTTRRDYLKPADVFAILDKPDTTKISTIPPINPKAGEYLTGRRSAIQLALVCLSGTA